MQRNLNTPNRWSRTYRLGIIAVAALTITACGPLGDDEDDPTATADVISQPTAAEGANPAATPPIGNNQPGVSLATPNVGLSTPIISNPVDPEGSQASPESASPGVAGTPVTSESPADGTTGTGAETAGAVFSGSDGTSGATPDLGGIAPAGSPVAQGISPDPGSTPAAGQSGSQLVAVTSCEPDSIPPFGGERVDFVTNANVFFRTGPGTDCDPIGDGPIAADTPVTVLSGPVVREEGDGFIWVQVQIDDQTGWVVPETLEPAP